MPLGEKRLYFTLHFQATFHTSKMSGEGNQKAGFLAICSAFPLAKRVEKKPWKNVACWLDCQLQDHLPRDGDILHQLIIKTVSHRHAHRPICSRKFLCQGFCLRCLQAVTRLLLKLTGLYGRSPTPILVVLLFLEWIHLHRLSCLRYSFIENSLFSNSEIIGTPNVLICLTNKLDQLFARQYPVPTKIKTGSWENILDYLREYSDVSIAQGHFFQDHQWMVTHNTSIKMTLSELMLLKESYVFLQIMHPY